ncbi:unnamed protein product [Paramecium octaurelia]|uniref:Uncharacterized protein n=1 Tax=Paramecium octaurelia TaxID=43137 RepID=A0A8S1WN43_PAROT|nr:unnamed protein product [Paramecium octaurelia]
MSSYLNTSVYSNCFEMIYSTIPKYNLSPNSTYTFLVTATNIITNQVQYENLTIDIPYSGLICQFSNRGIQSIRKDLNLYVDCKDLDTIFDWNSDPDLSIQVACKDLQMNSTCLIEQKQIINVNQTAPYQFIRRNSISTFTVQEWSVIVTKQQQTQKFSLIIVYLDDDFPILDLEFNKGYLMRKINNYEQLNFTFLIPFDQTPYILDLSIAIIYNYEIIEILQPKYVSHQFKIFNSIKELNLGDEVNIKFAAQYTNNIMPSLNNIKLQVNQPPQCSKLLITRSNNLALADIIVVSTCEISNDSPYKYQLKLFLRDSDLTDFLQGGSDNSLTLQAFQAQNQFSIQTPTSIDSSKIGILVQVLDNGGSMTQIFEQITVKPAKINCTSIQFQNLNLQGKVSLLFEAMNQKCMDLHPRIYNNLLQQSMSEDSNDNILKFQSIKLYKQSLIQSMQSEPLDNLKIDRCFDINSTHIFIMQNSTQPEVDLTVKIQNIKQNTNNLNKTLTYFRKLKKQCQDELLLNQYTWNEQVFQQFQSSQDCIRTQLYYLDDIYSNFSSIHQQNELLYQAVLDLTKFIPLISEETQNRIIVNQEPLIVNGNEIIWQMKRRTKSSFNSQFNIEAAQEDFLVDYIQFESLQFQTNPLRFSSELQDLLKSQFNDSTLKIYSQNYYLTQLKNVYHNRFILYENFSTIYGTKFGSYQVCNNTTQFLSEYEIQCVTRTVSGKLDYCHLNKLQYNSTIEIICECNKFGDIFLQTTTNFSLLNENMANQSQSDSQIISTSENFLTIEICISSLSFIFLSIYTRQIYKDNQNEQGRSNTEQLNLSPRNNFHFNKLTYQGNLQVFKERFKQIHQTISLFNYKDQSIQLSYRILEVLSQFNLLLTLAIVEFEMLDNQILYICLFIILNPFIILLMKFIYKIIETIYRFKRIAAFISHFLLILFLMIPNLITYVLSIMKKISPEEYKVALIFTGNILVSQVLFEPVIVFGRIFIYRIIAKSIKNMELNPVFHLMYFLAMHSSLEEIFEDFTRI